MEINILSFIIIIHKRYRQNCIESCIKYFFVQRLGSAILIITFYLEEIIVRALVILILSYKVGGAPIYFWFPRVCEGLDWISCFVLIFFQKVIPLILVSIFIRRIIWLTIISRLIVGAIGSFNQRRMKILIAYSSIHHLGWIFICTVFSDRLWVIYLLLYNYILFGVIYYFKKNEVLYFFEIGKCKGKWWFVAGILRIAGIPPLLGFFLKWITFLFVVNIRYLYVRMIVLTSVIIFYVYFRVIYDVFICYRGKNYIWDSYTIKAHFYTLDFYNIIGFVRGIIIFVIIM